MRNKVFTLFGKEVFGVKEFEVQPTAQATPAVEEVEVIPASSPSAYYSRNYGRGFSSYYTHSFNGEKNLGELGPVREFIIEYDELRARSWELFLTSEICQTVINRNVRWVIGSGLSLQAEPQQEVLADEGITVDPEEFNNKVEARFKIYSNSTMADYSNQRNLHHKADQAFANAIVGGDVLVILRYIDDTVKVQLIDGCHVQNPTSASFNGYDFINPETKNIIRYGVEISPTGEHVAYWVRTGIFDIERIPARGENSGILMAYLVIGLEYRLDGLRGIPLISAIMETVGKMERYKEATLGSAEERAKIAWFLKHGVNSTGENVLDRIKKANGLGSDTGIPVDAQRNQFADHVAATTNKATYNLPPDSEMQSLESKNELYFKDFYEVLIDLVCATVDIPPNVAMSNYDSNYSSSRAAIKDWEHTLLVKRKNFSDQFYIPIYKFWLQMQILNNKVPASGFLTALYSNNIMALEAYFNAEFVGAQVPHIDPEKEVRAERLKLGKGSEHIPLTTVEAATRALSGGDSKANMRQYALELQQAETEGIEKVATPGQQPKEEKDEEV